jgi:hypothetical protein
MLHADDRLWVEKNCYIDIWIEFVHALDLEPLAMLPFTIAIDFEGDQWTFFKPRHEEIRELYGIDVQELNVWRPLVEHAVEHLGAGKFINTEADSFWLPDTAGTDYRRQHTKSSAILCAIDVEARRLEYFHNASFYELFGEDFAGLFRLDVPEDPAFLPLFAEVMRLDGIARRPSAELSRMSFALLQKHFGRRPATNPVQRFQERFERELPHLQERGLPFYHAWAFATTRQLGAASELAALNLRWLAGHGYADLESAAREFEQISSAAKAFILKVARAVNTRKPPAAADMLSNMRASWDRAMERLEAALPAVTSSPV